MKPLQIFAILVLLGMITGCSGSRNSQTIEKSFDASSISLIDVRTFGDNRTIIGEDRRDISLKAEKAVRHINASQAEDLFKEIEMEIETRESVIELLK